MQDVRDQKKAFRAECRRKRSDISKTNGVLLSERMCEHFIASYEYKYADILLAYHPTGSEADILPLIKKALADGKRVALPICREDSDDMDFYFISSLDLLCIGRFSIPTPPPFAEKYLPSEDLCRAVIAVPALAFDKSGKRLGYGRGFYDKYLPRFFGRRVGFQFSELVFGALPCEEHDIAVNMIVTENGVITI